MFGKMETELMKWYRYIPNSDEFDAVRLVMEDDEPVIGLHYESRSVAQTWSPVRVEGFNDNPDVEGDFPSLNNYSKIPVCSQRAWDALCPLIENCSEALPIIHPSENPFYIINVMEIIDCLDEEQSELVRNSATGRVSQVYKYVFKANMVEGKHVFKTPLKSGAELIVDDDVRKTVEANGLKGLIFEPLPMKQ